MQILDTDGNPVETPDFEAGRLEERQRDVSHSYIVDVIEASHEEVLAEYPETGGKDVRIVIDTPEQGHWETRLKTGQIIEFVGELDPDTPRGMDIPGVEHYLLYRPCTPDELAQAVQEKTEREREEAKTAAREEFAETAPKRLDTLEATNNDMLLLMADMMGGAL